MTSFADKQDISPNPDGRQVTPRDPRHQMADMIYGYFVSQAVRAVAELSLADHLADEPLSAAELSAREGSDPKATARLLRAAVSFGLIDADGDGLFYGTELLGTLRSDAPNSLRGMALGATNTSHWAPWSEFPAVVRDGRSRAVHTLGAPIFEYLQSNPSQAQEFTEYMQSVTSLWAVDVSTLIDTTTVRTAVDVGGANGYLLRQLQATNPRLHGIVFDRPDVADDVAASIAESDVADRTRVVGGDFFQGVPEGDLMLLKFILHDWDDAACVRILRRCREALLPGGRVAIIEMVVGQDDDPGMAAMMDLNMLAMTDGGCERSLAEYDTLLNEAGLRRTAVHSGDSPQSIIEAIAN